MKRLHAIWELGDLPFHVGVRDSSKNTGVPDTFPFTLGVDRELGSLVQMPHPDLGGLLDQAYVEGSQIGTPMSDSPSGRPVADDFIAFICETLGTEDLDGIRILEVGCGKGYLMSRLAEMGATVLGFEPGHSSPIYAEKAGLTVLKEPFRRSAVDEQCDVILHYGVLEHVEDPRPFLLEQAEVLSPGGRIVFAVPDCAPAIECGDLSIIVHEHWSYFTEESLRSLATHYGFRVEQIQRGKAAGAPEEARERRAIRRNWLTLRAFVASLRAEDSEARRAQGRPISCVSLDAGADALSSATREALRTADAGMRWA